MNYYPNNHCGHNNPQVRRYPACSLKNGHDGCHMGYPGHDIKPDNPFDLWGMPVIREEEEFDPASMV